MRIQGEFLIRLMRVVYYTTFVFCFRMILMYPVWASVVSSRMLEKTKLDPKTLDRQLSITFFNFVYKYRRITATIERLCFFETFWISRSFSFVYQKSYIWTVLIRRINKKNAISQVKLSIGYKSRNDIATVASYLIAAFKRTTTIKQDMNESIRDLCF